MDKRVPITFILALIVQTAVVTTYLGNLRNDIDGNVIEITRNRVELDKHEQELRILRQANNQQAILLGKIEVELKNLNDSIIELKDVLDDRNRGPLER